MANYVSIKQITESLRKLDHLHPFFGFSFFAFKDAKIPINTMHHVNFSLIARNILATYYKPSSTYNGYYNPFKTSNKNERWVSPRYESTSLQRITTDTFGDAMIHPKGSMMWGWHSDYINRLSEHMGPQKIPAFDLAAWMFRNKLWSDNTEPQDVIQHLITTYSINELERDKLFDLTLPIHHSGWLYSKSVSEAELLDITGIPPGTKPVEGAALQLLELRHIGPATVFSYHPGERLNMITGDNSLGKTFILDCAWWALTEQWIDSHVLPRKTVGKDEPKIAFAVTTPTGREERYQIEYDWARQRWKPLPKRRAWAGLVVYARYDGSFAVWDPAKAYQAEQDSASRTPAYLYFRRDQIWEGLPAGTGPERLHWMCNGLIRDWVSWQTGGNRYAELYNALTACLRILSPSESEPLTPGEPVRLPNDVREFPTIRMAYGDVPVVHASAGIQRVVALAYILVWSWHEHLSISELVRSSPERRLVMLIDEVEAHLHPKWQRIIVPALMNVVKEISTFLKPQLHLATHSPLVMASLEPFFAERIDSLFHLRLDNDTVFLEELEFKKRGRADSWLMSDVFGLGHARSVEAERAIKDAKAVQSAELPSPVQVKQIDERLIRYLAQDDEFWPRWRFFALRYGLKE